VLAVAVLEKLQLRQFHVKKAFLQDTLQEEVYMCQPEGFDNVSGWVCKLKQAPGCWNQRFVDFMKKERLKVSTVDSCIFVRQRNGKKLIVAIYVDDGMIAGSDESEIDVFTDQLRCNFKIMMGTLSNFLGIHTEQRHDGIFVFQRIYTEMVFDRVMMHAANPAATPCDHSSGESENSVGTHVPYREAVGYLMYLNEHIQTAFAMSRAARAMDRPTEANWTDVERILKYLWGTSNYGLLYGAGNSKWVFEAFSDFADDVRTRRSMSGVVAVYAGSATAWSS